LVPWIEKSLISLKISKIKLKNNTMRIRTGNSKGESIANNLILSRKNFSPESILIIKITTATNKKVIILYTIKFSWFFLSIKSKRPSYL